MIRRIHRREVKKEKVAAATKTFETLLISLNSSQVKIKFLFVFDTLKHQKNFISACWWLLRFKNLSRIEVQINLFLVNQKKMTLSVNDFINSQTARKHCFLGNSFLAIKSNKFHFKRSTALLKVWGFVDNEKGFEPCWHENIYETDLVLMKFSNHFVNLPETRKHSKSMNFHRIYLTKFT